MGTNRKLALMRVGDRTILLSIDVEDWFHSSNLERAVGRRDWADFPLRVAEPTRRILDLLNRHQLKATFFVLGWSAERDPALIRDIANQGHEIACHGYGHDVLTRLNAASLREDLQRAVDAIGAATGRQPLGYRAPSFSITEWALDVLAELGFRYDSSYFPTMAHDKYGRVAADPRRPSLVRHDLHEVPISVLQAHKPWPWGGGAYFRFLPYPLFEAGVNRILRKSSYYLFYLHPWELDPDQPRLRGLSLSSSVRHRFRLSSTETRFVKFLKFAARYRTKTILDYVDGFES